MDDNSSLVEVSGTYSSVSVLGTIAALIGVSYLLYHYGVLGWVIGQVSRAIGWAIRLGFDLWEDYLSWADWHIFLFISLGLTAIGALAAMIAPPVTLICAVVVLFMGVTACLAFMSIDIERYEVERGYKAVHNPQPGQEHAPRLAKYGHQVHVLLLIASAIAMLGGFALLNHGLYASFGSHWYAVQGEGVGFDDFLAYTMLNLLRVVDVLDIASSKHLLRVSFVRPAMWPASVLIVMFRSFCTLVLLQQIFASIRQGRLLTETISDFWSPHEPIQKRARTALPQYGPAAIGPLLMSLRAVVGLTKEQREVLPQILAAIGPSTIPTLLGYLRDPHEDVRAVSAAALGHLNARNALSSLVESAEDESDHVRQSLAQGMGFMLSEAVRADNTARARGGVLRPRRRWFRLIRPRSIEATPTGPILETLRKLLGDTHAAVRCEAAKSLGQAGILAGTAIPDLIMRLGDSDETVRCEAAAALGRVGKKHEEAMLALAETLEDPSPEVRSAAARALGSLGVEAAPASSKLMDLLKDRDEDVRTVAAEALAKVGPLTEESTVTLVGGLSSRDNVVRAQTAEALGTIGATVEDAAEALTARLRDSNDVVRAKAAEALGKIGESASDVAVPGLVKALRDKDSWVSALAAESLGKMGEAANQAVPALTKSLAHVNSQVRGNAAATLGILGSGAERARASLEKTAADTDGGVRAEAVRALGMLGQPTPTTLKAIRRAINDLDPEVRAAGVEAISQVELPAEELEALLLPLLADANDEVKVQAITALTETGSARPDVVEGLGQMLAMDDSSLIQVQAAIGLARLGPAAAQAGPILLRAAQTGEACVREQAMSALAIVQPEEARKAFTVGLTDPSAEVRLIASAGWMNAESIPPDAAEALVKAMKDSETKVRANAALALSRLESLPVDAIPPLLESTEDTNELLRINATLALQKAPLTLTETVMSHLLEDPNGRVRLLAAEALLEADPTHKGAKATAESARNDPSSPVRQAAGELLASLTTPTPTPAMSTS